ncbi:hypothetical protein [Loktanella sp. SALINAS62]|uniref:hypothetical protein n=1 Tax=Loktanella sp. SALINAS62 TaxID=2706124 RepID=UPI001B8D79D5|nr:hypothetical protein [Loktanella sp. SALINAS62]MBS1303756.1 hypothetical protein [Loktanella sp. SALINAS62]
MNKVIAAAAFCAFLPLGVSAQNAPDVAVPVVPGMGLPTGYETLLPVGLLVATVILNGLSDEDDQGTAPSDTN